MSSVSSAAQLLSAEEAQRKIEYIQAELLRVQRACEYRDEHPYDSTEAHNTAEYRSRRLNGEEHCDGGTSRHAGRAEASEPSVKLVNSSNSHIYSVMMKTPRSCDVSVGGNGGDVFTTVAPSGHTKTFVGGGKGSGGARHMLSFSEFERRRIAQLLGRVAVEIATVWAYVQQCGTLGDTATPVYTATTPSSTPMNTARGPARQSSERSVATAAPASERGLSLQQQQSKTNSHGNDRRWEAWSPPDATACGASQLSDRGEERGRLESMPAAVGSHTAQMAALNTLIQTAVSIQRMLAGDWGEGGDRDGESGPAALSPVSTTPAQVHADVIARNSSADTALLPHSAVPSTSATQWDDSSISGPPPPSAELEHTLPAVTNALPATPSLPQQTARTQQQQQQQPSQQQQQHLGESSGVSFPNSHASSSNGQHGHPTSSASAAQAPVIPDYLKKYVWEDPAKTPPASSEAKEEEDDDATVVVNVDRGDSRSVSAGSVTGANLRSFSRVSDVFAGSHAESHHTSPLGAEVPLGNSSGNTNSGPHMRFHGNASGIIAHHRFDSDMGFNTPASPFKRVVSCSSLRSSSLIGSPVQAQQYSHPRSQGYSTCSVHSQPLHTNSLHCHSHSHSHSNNNNSSSAGRSPDSTEMSPAAAAAYSRSTSLLRRPHRLEVPISRTQSLRRVPSYTSPTSVTSGGGGDSSPPGGGGVVPSSTTGNAFNAPAYTSGQQTGKVVSNGGGVDGYAQAAPGLARSPPVMLSTSVTGDSPHSSIVGLHFKRVISVDSENGGWPPGSLADSLEMSHSKAASLFGRPVATSYSTNVTPSPALQEAAGASGEWQCIATASAPTELALLTGGGGPGGAGADVGGASTASSALTTSYVVPGRADSFRGGGSVHSRNLTPYYFPSPSGAPTRVSVPAPPTPSRPIVQQQQQQQNSNAGKALSSVTARTSPSMRPTATAGGGAALYTQGGSSRSTSGSATGLAKPAESAPLPPHSYKIDPEKLANFLQCVRGLVQTEFSEDEFDSMHLFYFLPGVSLVKPTPGHEKEGAEGCEGRTSFTSSTAQKEGNADAPLPLFPDGERVPVRLTKLDVFYSLVKRKVQEVCDNAGVPSEPYLALL
jgi:hypothetical protein